MVEDNKRSVKERRGNQTGEKNQILIIAGLKGERIKNEDRVSIEEKTSHVLHG